MRSIVLAIAAGLALTPALAASAAPPPGISVGPNVNVSRMPGNQAETTVAINPLQPANVAIFSNIQFGGALFEGFTTDGTRWTSRRIATGQDGLEAACCDASAAFDEFGNLFLVYLGGVEAKDVVLALSTDGGATVQFVTRVEQTNVQGKSTTKWGTIVDQPTVVAAGGTVWVTYKIFADNRHIMARGAPVFGLGKVGAFSAPEEAAGSNGGNQREGSFGDIAIGPHGEVMVVYQNALPFNAKLPATVFVNVDPDGLGPQGLGPAIAVTTTNVNGFDFIPAQIDRSVDAETGLAWDRSGGPHTGRVYLLYTDSPTGNHDDTNIFVRHSDDAGQHWSAPVRVNDDTGTNSQFNPKISLDQTTGNIAITWYDARNDLGDHGPGDTDGIPNDDAQFWGAVSTDGGASFSQNVQISAGTSNSHVALNGVDFGDYSGLAFNGGVFYPAWADNSNSTGDNPDGTLSKLDVYTARVTVG